MSKNNKVVVMINVAHLKVKKIRKGFLVVNTKTGNHTHMRSKYGCYCIIKFIREGIEPDNPYLQESKRRLTVEREWRKDRYINIQKGVRE
jgi:hypothetical protein